MPPNRKLTRARATRQPKRRFHIFCEGRNTEPSYLNALKHYFRGTLIDIHITKGAGVPKTIADKAAAKRKALGRRGLKRDSFEEHDEVWAVFDRDEHPNFEQAIDICLQGNVKVGRSNPCFEVWLILHIQAYDKLDDRLAVQRKAAQIVPGYDHKKGKSLNCEALLELVEDAEERAERQLAARKSEGNDYGQPSTTFGQLTASIRSAAEKFSGN